MKTTFRILCLLLIAALLLGAAPGADDAGWHYDADFAADGLGGTLERYLAEKGLGERNLTIGWRDIESGEEWYLGADVFSEGASTYKLPLAMLYADWVDEGLLTREDKVGAYTVDEAVREALVRSSNNAADALRYAVSGNQVTYRTEIARNCGLPLDELPSGYYTANQFSPRYLIGTLQTLWDNAGKYGWILDYMKQAQPDSFFSRWRGDYEVAHKTGNALGYVCDTGVVYTARPFLLTVMSGGLQNAEQVIAEIARIAMDYAEYLAAQDAPAPTSEPTSVPTPEPAAAAEEAVLPAPGADGVREIADAAALRAIALDPAGSYRLTADIDLGGADWTPLPFTGTLDGAGHTIYNLTIRAPGAEVEECRDGNNKPYEARYAGLFSAAKFATIRDLNLKGVYAELESEDSCFVAALAGYAYDLTVENVGVEGRIRLYAHGKIVGVGGMVGFGSGWFSDCTSDVELVFEDRNTGLHCEQFLGGLVASGKFTAERCRVDVRGYASVNGFVHTGGMVGMYCGYGLVRDRMMSIVDCTVTGKISFFENNFTRRAYCRGLAGEQVDLLVNERNDISGFVRDERFRYDLILSPESCGEPDYVETVTAPDCARWGCTDHVCQGCGYAWRDSYTPPRHSPGEWTVLREADVGCEGERVRTCTVCGEVLERESIGALSAPEEITPQSIVLSQSDLSLRSGSRIRLEAVLLPEDASACALLWTSLDEKVAEVSEDGTVTAKRGGETVIVCASADGSLRAECRVTVSESFLQRILSFFRR